MWLSMIEEHFVKKNENDNHSAEDSGFWVHCRNVINISKLLIFYGRVIAFKDIDV